MNVATTETWSFSLATIECLVEPWPFPETPLLTNHRLGRGRRQAWPLANTWSVLVDFGYICTYQSLVVQLCVYEPRTRCHICATWAKGEGDTTRTALTSSSISRLQDWQGLLRSWTRLGNRNEYSCLDSTQLLWPRTPVPWNLRFSFYETTRHTPGQRNVQRSRRLSRVSEFCQVWFIFFFLR